MKLARVFSAGAGCSSAFYLALAAIFASLPYGRSQAPAAVTMSRPRPDVLGIHLRMCPREACAVFEASHPKDKGTIHPYAFTTIRQLFINGLSSTSPPQVSRFMPSTFRSLPGRQTEAGFFSELANSQHQQEIENSKQAQPRL